MFILRSQDKLALAAYHGAEVSDGAQKEIDAFRQWTGRKKSPD